MTDVVRGRRLKHPHDLPQGRSLASLCRIQLCQFKNGVQMVGHEDILMQADMRKPSRQRDPHRLCNLPWALQSDLAIDNRAKYQAMVLCTDGDKIKPWLTVVIPC